MATKSGDVIFRAGEDTDASGIWDDTALIDAYDRAINAIKGGSKNGAKTKTSGKNRKQQPSKRKENKKKVEEQDFGLRWHVGDLCQAVFSEDELIYDAVIISIDSNSRTCVVRFSGYGNEEEQDLADILPPLSNRDSKSPRQDAMHVGSTNYLSSDNEMEWSSQSPIRWQISDLCLALELPSRHFHEAVINSFPTPYTCTVTFLRSRKRQDVPISSLKPSHATPCYKHNVSSVHNSRHRTPGAQFLNYPGPSSFLSSMSFFPPPPPPPPPLPQTMQHYWQTPGIQSSSTTNTFPFAPMPPPPAPVSSSDVAHDNDALASMLMAWYLSGYHTGYYQAIQHLRQGSKTGTSDTQVTTTETHPEEQHSSQLPKSEN